mmetsp:Transcript_84475/g.235655  ORF Transcript_84475/g.235655 Transcript_84475/m.235655 type:complete len:239 (+) Transcript_84475:228-944(+)
MPLPSISRDRGRLYKGRRRLLDHCFGGTLLLLPEALSQCLEPVAHAWLQCGGHDRRVHPFVQVLDLILVRQLRGLELGQLLEQLGALVARQLGDSTCGSNYAADALRDGLLLEHHEAFCVSGVRDVRAATKLHRLPPPRAILRRLQDLVHRSGADGNHTHRVWVRLPGDRADSSHVQSCGEGRLAHGHRHGIHDDLLHKCLHALELSNADSVGTEVKSQALGVAERASLIDTISKHLA